MSLQLQQTTCVRLFQEITIQIRILQGERHVHTRTVCFGHWAVVEAVATVDGRIQQVRFGDVVLFHRSDAAVLLQPLKHQAGHVDAIGRRGVVHRFVIGVSLVIHHGRQARIRMTHQVFTHDDQRQTSWADILLCACVDEAELRYIDLTRQDVGRHVRHQRHITRLGYPVELDAADGLVRRVVHVGRILVQLPCIESGNIGAVLVFVVGNHVHVGELLRFADGLLRPFTCVHVIGRSLTTQQVQRDHGELQMRAALQEQHLVVGGDTHQLAQIGFGLCMDTHVLFATVRHLHHRHTAAVPIKQFRLSLLQYLLG